MRRTIVLFGASERGAFRTPYLVRTLPELASRLGEPPPESEGLFFAIQAILYERDVLYFRVPEEGCGEIDYRWGLNYLNNPEQVDGLSALCLPGIGNPLILEETRRICLTHGALLIISQKDLYDYLTA